MARARALNIPSRVGSRFGGPSHGRRSFDRLKPACPGNGFTSGDACAMRTELLRLEYLALNLHTRREGGGPAGRAGQHSPR